MAHADEERIRILGRELSRRGQRLVYAYVVVEVVAVATIGWLAVMDQAAPWPLWVIVATMVPALVVIEDDEGDGRRDRRRRGVRTPIDWDADPRTVLCFAPMVAAAPVGAANLRRSGTALGRLVGVALLVADAAFVVAFVRWLRTPNDPRLDRPGR